MKLELLSGLTAVRELDNRYYGVTTGVVTDNADPAGLGRVKVKFPWLGERSESFWARLATPMAGGERGFYCLPEVDDEVLVAFERGRVDHPYVLGALWNGKSKPPESNEDGKNNRRVFRSRSGSVIRFDDTDGAEKITIEDAGGHSSITIDAAGKSIEIATSGKLKLHGKEIEITSDAGLKIEASAQMDISANANLAIKGIKVDIN